MNQLLNDVAAGISERQHASLIRRMACRAGAGFIGE